MAEQKTWFEEQDILEVLTEKPQFLREIAAKIENKGIYEIVPTLERLVKKGLVLKTKSGIRNKNLYKKNDTHK